MARPTKYKDEFCQKIIRYFKRAPYKERKIVTTGKNDYRKEDYKRFPNRMPTFHEFADKIGVNEDTVVEWAKATYSEKYKVKSLRGKLKYPEFSAAYKKAKQLQKWFLIDNGLGGMYSAPFAIFTAKNITDMRDRVEVVPDPEAPPVQHEHNHTVSPELQEILKNIQKAKKNGT